MDSNEPSCIDLHIHSNASDGTYSPKEIIRSARQLNIKAISITDHDTVDGSRAVLDDDLPAPFEYIPGLEISTSPPDGFKIKGSMHILGYGMNLDDFELNRILSSLQNARDERNPKIVDCLNRMGIQISMDELNSEYGGGQIGRPHIAQLLKKKGFVVSVDEAFEKYLGTGRPAYLDKYRIDCNRAIEIIANAGGITFLAHPFLLNLTDIFEIENLIMILKSMGISGVEAYYSDHTKEQTKFLIDIAMKNDLLISGGSDFHGNVRPDIRIGSGKGDLSIPYSLYRELKNRLKSNGETP